MLKTNKLMGTVLIRFINDSIIIAFILMMFLLPGCIEDKSKDNHVNKIEVYKVPWWNVLKSDGRSGEWGRPTYGVINIDNGKLTIRHAILEGRPLRDYRLPYSAVRSFLSFFSKSAELTHQSSVSFTLNDSTETFPFVCGDKKYGYNSMKNKRIEEGFEVAQSKDADILKITNRGSESPLLMEHYFVIEQNSFKIPVYIKITNITDKTIKDIEAEILYTQDFNWDSFGISNSEIYKPIEPPDSGNAKCFYAYSSGMERGFEFNQIKGCELAYKLNPEFNVWNISITNPLTTLEPGESIMFSYKLSIIDGPLDKVVNDKFISEKQLEFLEFENLIPFETRTAPINPNERVMIHDVINNIDEPKVRGLHSITGLPGAFEDIKLLKEWGGNLAITTGNPDEVKQITEYGHNLGMEIFVPGSENYMTGLPLKFDHFFNADFKPHEFPDSYGQDEDHYYWHPVKPNLDFKAEFGKPMSKATQEEKVIYWSRCFVNKWRQTLKNVREFDPNGNIWFYMPSPGVANIDPFDYYDLFFSEVSKLGDALTVFPFYYGTDYNQIEYMVHRWKNAGISRVVFLPGAPTYLKPSQFIHAITAARRGGADGACGFAFSVSEEEFDDEWRWKSVMLASHANFPTPELDAYCFIEEPAELLELLAVSEVSVFSETSDTEVFSQSLEQMLSDKVYRFENLPENDPEKDQLFIIIGGDTSNTENYWPYDLKKNDPGADKGVVQMVKNIVKIDGSNKTGIKNAELLFLRFAELIKAERKSIQ